MEKTTKQIDEGWQLAFQNELHLSPEAMRTLRKRNLKPDGYMDYVSLALDAFYLGLAQGHECPEKDVR